MKRILSLITALVLVMSLTSVFAATADWNGYFQVEYRALSQKDKTTSLTSNYAYFFQKLELYPTWKLSDNVALHAGFFTQNYWGNGRFYGFGTEEAIKEDTGNFKSGAGGVMGTGTDPLLQPSYTAQDDTLGVSSAWATLTFMDQKLGIDVGRRLNAEWGTGLFLGSPFTPDRIFLTYKTPGLGGLMIPFFIYEHRVDNNMGSNDTVVNRMNQILVGLIYLAPGKTLAGIVFNPNFVSKNYVLANGVAGTSGYTKDSQIFWVNNLYVKHKINLGTLSVTPEFEFNWGFGTILDNQNIAGAAYVSKLKLDSKGILIKAAVNMPKMITATPEFAISLKPKNADAATVSANLYDFNQFCGANYRIGLIYNGQFSNKQLAFVNPAFPTFDAQEVPSSFYAKLRVDADLLNEIVPGLGAYAQFIYAGVFGQVKRSSGATLTDSDKPIATEVDLGVSYKVDANTTVKLDLGYAKWGKNTKYLAASQIERTDMYIGADLVVKF